MGEKVTFNSLTKIITIDVIPDANGEVDIDVKQDIYSDGKADWVTSPSLRKYTFPITSVGGNALPGSKELGATFFLDSDWKIRPYEADQRLTVNGNLYSEDGTSPFTSTIGSFNVLLEQQVSSLVDSTVQQLADIEYSSFQSGVWIDAVNGDDDVKGNEQYPVKTVAAALSVAATRGFRKIYLLSDISMLSGNIEDMEIIGQSHVHTDLYIAAEVDCLRVKVSNVSFTGVLDGDTELDNCIVGSCTYFNGHIHDCGLNGTIVLGGNKKALIANSRTIDQDNSPVIDMGSSGQSLAMPNYSGTLLIKNLSDPNQEIGIGMDAGMLTLDSTITAGSIILAGIGLLEDNSTGASVNTDGLMNRSLIGVSVWDENLASHLSPGTTGLVLGISQFNDKITISTSGTSGTTFPIGTPRVPVNNIVDAVTIAEARGIRTLHFKSDFTIGVDISIVGYTLQADGLQQTTLTCEDGCILAYCTFKDATVEGPSIGAVGFVNCLMIDTGSANPIPSSVTVIADNCIFKSSITLPSLFTGKLYAIDCCGVPDDSGNSPFIDMNGADFDIELRGWSGFCRISNCVHASSGLKFMMNAGGIIIDPTTTAGQFVFSGNGTLTDESTSITSLDTTSLINQAGIATAVWDESIGEHLISGSTGRSIGVQQFAEYVHISTTGSSGTTFPIGTENSPVDNIVDAVTIAGNNGITKFKILSDFEIIGGTYSGYYFTGKGRKSPTLTFDGTTLTGCQFERLRLTGTSIEGVIGCNFCTLVDFSGSRIHAYECVFEGVIGLRSGESNFYTCVDGVPGIGIPDIQVLDCASLGIWNWNGGIQLSNINVVGAEITCMIAQGRLWVDDTCVEGNIIVKGLADLRGTTGGTTIDSGGLITKDTIATSVWSYDKDA